MLKKRTYSVSVLLLAIAFPAAALGSAGGKARTHARASARAATPATGLALLSEPATSLRRSVRVQLHRIRAERRSRLHRERRLEFASLPGGVSQATLDAIGECESGGDPTAVSADGTYRGKYQFDQGTWESVGGSGDPAAAPVTEQDYRAALLYERAGSSPWPVCG